MTRHTLASRWGRRLAVALLTFANACSSAPQRPSEPAADGAAVNWQRIENGVIVRPASGQPRTIRLQVMTDSIIRVTATPADSLNLPASLMVVAKPLNAAKFDVSVQDDVLNLKTTNTSADVSLISGKVKFRDASGRVVLDGYNGGEFTPVKVDGQSFYAVRQQFNRSTDEGLYGLGQHENGQYNYNGQDVDLAQHNVDIALPLVVSSRNYGVLWDNNGITRFGDPREYRPISAELKVTDSDDRPGGLTARYALNGRTKLTRVESDVNYQYIKDLANWPAVLTDASGNTQPLPGKQSVTWAGKLESGMTGGHKFRLYVSSYVKLYLDGKLVVDAWRQNWNPWYRNFDVPMTAGVPVSIRIEWIPNGGYIRLLHANPLPAEERHELSFASEVARSIDYYFIAGKDYDDVISGYRQLTGKALLLPRWAFGYWQSRDRYKTQAELVDTLREYRRRKLPIDNIVQDWRYWRDDSWGSHAFDAERYPDPKRMVQDVHALHGHIMISVWPKFYPMTDNYKELDAVGGVYHGNIDAGAKDWVGPGYLSTYYDPYNTKAADIFWRQVQDRLDKLGFDAWWLDNDEPDIRSNISIPEREAIMGPTAIGPGAEYFNTFPLVHVGVVYDHWHAQHPDTRLFLFTRSAYGGIQRYSAAVWSGDLATRWSDLHDQIAAGLGISMAGMPNWTFDIGGFAMEDRFVKPDSADLAEWRELYTRWFQFGAFAPIFRAHGQARPEEGEGRPREIYRISPPGTEVYDTLAWYDRLRYRLMPYIYTLAGRVYHDDYTMMRGLVMDFPRDGNVRDIADEYMFGPSFLVAPVTEYWARSRTVYLPAGTRWYDFYTGKVFDGGRTITANAPLRHMPLFVKEGSIVPIGPDAQYTGQKPGAPITLNIYTGESGIFDLYEDDGTSYGYTRGEWSRIRIRYDEASGTLSIGAREGAFPGMANNRTFAVRWISGPTSTAVRFDAKPDRSVPYSGEAIELHRGAAAAVLRQPKPSSRHAP
jgi:alpha-D-xyloside xylohydrolase